MTVKRLFSLAIVLLLAVPWRLEAGQQTLAGDVQVGNDIGSITPTVEGATNTYVFTPDNLNMAGYKIYYNTAQRHLILTNLTDLTDSGGTAIIDTSRATDLQKAGFVRIYASSRLALGGYIKTSTPLTRYGDEAGAVVVAVPSIVISGTNASGLSIDSRGRGNGGAVTLLATNVTVAGGISSDADTGTYGSSGGAITINDGAGGPARVEVGGDLISRGRTGSGGAISIVGTCISVSNINTRSISSAGGAVTLTATGTVAVGGYITTGNAGTAGDVSITSGVSIVVGGTTNGFSIEAGAATGGSVSLWATNVILAGGIAANGKSDGSVGAGKAVTIHNGSGGPARVAIGGDVISYGRGGGAVTVVAPEISIPNIDTRSYYSDPSAPGGAVTLTATGTVAVSGYITTGYAGTAGDVSITSGASIVVGGTTNGFSIEAGAETGGSVSLWATNVILAGGIAANGKSDGTKGAGKAVTIHNGSGGPARVAIGGDVTSYGRGGGAVTVVGTDISVSNINTRSAYEYNAAGAVTLTATGTVAVGGYITTANIGSGGAVSITAGGSIVVGGTTNGIGIETRATKSNGAYYGGNITLVSSNGDIKVTGGFDASAAYGLTRRGTISLSATNGGITVGSLDANRFKTISIQAAAGRPVYVTGAITNFSVSEDPKKITFPSGSAIGNDVYYLVKENTAIPLSGTYAIFSGTSDTGRLLKQVQDQGTLLIVW